MADPATQPQPTRHGPAPNVSVPADPLGAVQDEALPAGKYYPSNYERTHLRPPGQLATGLASIRSDSEVPKYRPGLSLRAMGRDSMHVQSDSEARRRLQQYQRDMLAQASLATTKLMSVARRHNILSTATTSPLPPPLQAQSSAPASDKPLSPRLLPLGSPGGPVTPMELEVVVRDSSYRSSGSSTGDGGGGNGGYLTLGRPATATDTDRQSREISQAIRAEKARQRRERHGSPVVELGPLAF